MKHEKKEWYTCDRCGNIIKETPSGAGRKHILHRIICKPTELEMLTANRFGYITDTNLISPEIVSVEITESYTEHRKQIHLCGKCRKEFEKFLKGECVNATNRT